MSSESPSPRYPDAYLIPQGELLARRQRYRTRDLLETREGGLHADVWLPTDLVSPSESPIIVFIHGGGWILGASSDVSSPEIEYYNEQGFIVVSLEYRLMPHATFEVMRTDLLDGYRWIVNSLNSKINNMADTTRLCVSGCSAGGALAVYLAHDAVAAGLPIPKALVLIFGVLDWTFNTEGAQVDGKSAEYLDLLLAQAPETSVNLIPANHPRSALGQSLIRQGRLVEMLLDGCDDKRAPIELLHDKFPATCLISAGNDELVPKKQTHDFFHALQDLGVQARLVEWAEGTHGFTFDGKNDQGSECWNTVTRPACDFVIAKTRR